MGRIEGEIKEKLEELINNGERDYRVITDSLNSHFNFRNSARIGDDTIKMYINNKLGIKTKTEREDDGRKVPAPHNNANKKRVSKNCLGEDEEYVISPLLRKGGVGYIKDLYQE